MGFGDVVLLAMIGSFIGWQGALAVFFIAPLCAIIAVAMSAIVRFDREIPYGPYLSLATLILLLGGRWIWPKVELILALGPLVPFVGACVLVLLTVSLYFTRLVQILLGIQYDGDVLSEPVWTAADQLAHYSGECVDDRQGQWSRDRWPGDLTGRGIAQYFTWRNRWNWK
jgi:leader peptidase (prepilin peptidase)/N-methyltransferase